MTQEQTTADEILYCTVHPDRETTLRCNKCGRPMCTKCAVPTPVGYRCRECVRGIQDNYYTATRNDYIVIFAACAALTGVAAAIISAIGLGLLFALILGLPLGGVIAEAGLRVTSRRRGRQSATIAAAGAVVGGIIGGLIQLLLAFGPRLSRSRTPVFELLFQRLTSDFGLIVFIIVAAVAVYGRFKMRS
ncbi:MAG: B-box zinc finger protein [Chloroflexota bacterium]